MSEVKYNLISVNGEGNITVVVDGEMYTANDQHPNWQAIVAAAVSGDTEIVDLFDTSKAVARKFEALSERVSVANGHIFFDGEEIHNALAEQVLRFLDEGVEDYKPLVAFWEKVATNPQEDSREQLFRFVQTNGITITPEGDLVLYKGVDSDGEGGWTSIHAGPAIVNGESVNGKVPQPIGGVVEMARGQVAFDPSVACHTGLHAGAWTYANSFGGGNVLTVKVNPRDVVSVPLDHSDQKVRVCRYTVVEVVSKPFESAVAYEFDYADSDDEEETCWVCGESDCDDFDNCGEVCDYCLDWGHTEDDCAEKERDFAETEDDDEEEDDEDESQDDESSDAKTLPPPATIVQNVSPPQNLSWWQRF